MAIVTYPHAPKFISFDYSSDLESVKQILPYQTRLLVGHADQLLLYHVQKIHVWCADNSKGRYARYWTKNHAEFFFEFLEDALLAKLIWA